MDVKAVDEFDHYTVVYYEFMNAHGHKSVQPIIKGKDKVVRKSKNEYVFSLKDSGAEVIVGGPFFLVTKHEEEITARRKQPGECKVCSAMALGTSKLCKQHGGVVYA